MLYVGTAIQVLENLGNKKFKDHGVMPLVQAPDSYKPKHEGNEWNDFIESILFRDLDADGDMDIYLASGSKKTNGAVAENLGGFEFNMLMPEKARSRFDLGKNGVIVRYSAEYQEKINEVADTDLSKLINKQ